MSGLFSFSKYRITKNITNFRTSAILKCFRCYAKINKVGKGGNGQEGDNTIECVYGKFIQRIWSCSTTET